MYIYWIFFIVTLPSVNYTGNSDQVNDQVNDQVKFEVDGKISDLALMILKVINDYPGIRVPKIYELIKIENSTVTVDKIRNEIKRKLANYIEHKGSDKTGGYYIKK